MFSHPPSKNTSNFSGETALPRSEVSENVAVEPASAKTNPLVSRNTKIAWVSPTMELGFYIQPVLRELRRRFPKMTIFTSLWPGFVPGCEETFEVRQVGKHRELTIQKSTTGYDRTLQILSLKIVPQLTQFRPEVVFVTGFSLWTLLVVLLKLILRWRIVLIYSGSSPNVDMQDVKLRLWLRRLIARQVDGFITNSQGGKKYLTEVLNVAATRVFARPYQIPDKAALLQKNTSHSFKAEEPIGINADPKGSVVPLSLRANCLKFLYVGQAVHRKGIPFLLQACEKLQQQGYENYQLIVIGDGKQRQELENWVQERNLNAQVRFEGWVSYGNLGSYFQSTDVFVFPTLEDIWGMVVLEAMLFGKPILCSNQAGALEMVASGENGYLFDPQNVNELATLMLRFIQNPDLVQQMGQRSQELIAPYTPETAAQFFEQVVATTLGASQNFSTP